MTRGNPIIRLAIYCWVAPTSGLGILFFLPTVAFGGQAQIVDGVLELHGGASTWFLSRVVGLWLRGGAAAMTLGHVVLGRNEFSLDATRDHERVHVRQCERWGPLFIPAYLSASLWVWMRGREAYRDNPFERQAFIEVG